MSEAELHVLKERMYQGKLNKARRGEPFVAAPIGYVKLPDGALAIDPDEQVQAVVRLVFDQFDCQGTLHGLLRYLVHHHIQIPVRPRTGARKGQLEWRRPNREALLSLMRHPIYAGAYRYGHRQAGPRRQQPGRPSTGRQVQRPEGCLVLIRDRLPAYVSWERFEANQERLRANRARHDAAGAPRGGAALLGGLLVCGRRGLRTAVRCSGPGDAPAYSCNRASVTYAEPLCQSLSGQGLDDLVAGQILAAVQPAALEASLAAAADVERERAELTRHWQLRIERVRHEADRAHRQCQACEPENRLVARELERRWEEALRQQRQLEEEFARWQRDAPSRLSAQDQGAIRALAADLPALWQAETATPADRKRIARLLLECVTVVVDKESEQVAVRLHWIGGLVCEHKLSRPVGRYDRRADHGRLAQRLREPCEGRPSSSEIASRLNDEGFHPPKRAKRFSGEMALRLAMRLVIQRRARPGSGADLGKDEHRPTGLARLLGVSRDVVRRWLRVGWLNVRRDADNRQVIWADADELRRLRELRGLTRTWPNRARLAELKKPKQRPAR